VDPDANDKEVTVAIRSRRASAESDANETATIRLPLAQRLPLRSYSSSTAEVSTGLDRESRYRNQWIV